MASLSTAGNLPDVCNVLYLRNVSCKGNNKYLILLNVICLPFAFSDVVFFLGKVA